MQSVACVFKLAEDICNMHKELLPNQYERTNNQIEKRANDTIQYYTEKEIYMVNKPVTRCLIDLQATFPSSSLLLFSVFPIASPSSNPRPLRLRG